MAIKCLEMIIGGGESRQGVTGGYFSTIIGNCGNYPELLDVMLVGNHHTRK